jgi:putative zinc finger/helix-turn-helix YgiT family protein
MKTMLCPICKHEGKIQIGRHHYTESGLRNVWLNGVENFNCSHCEENFAFIPCAQELHKMIAQILIKKEDQLSGREIRFLRKNMGMKAKDFAKELGVKPVTVSRWENGDSPPHESLDRLMRLFYAVRMGLGEIATELVEDQFHRLQKGQKESPIYFPLDKIKREPCLI